MLPPVLQVTLNQTSTMQHRRRPLSLLLNGLVISRTQMMRMMKCLSTAQMISLLNPFRTPERFHLQEAWYAETAWCHFLPLPRILRRIQLLLDPITKPRAAMSDPNCPIRLPLEAEHSLSRSRNRNGNTSLNPIHYMARVNCMLSSKMWHIRHTALFCITCVPSPCHIWIRQTNFEQIYTDTIVFAPLSSSFNSSAQTVTSSSVSLPAQLISESQNNISVTKATQQGDISTTIRPNTRRSWITEWQTNNPGRPTPCSAKAVYRLADSMLCSWMTIGEL